MCRLDENEKYTSNNVSEHINQQSRITGQSKSRKSYSEYSQNQKNNFQDLRITDETNSKNMSVSDITNEEDQESRRRSFISGRSRTNSFVSGKADFYHDLLL